MALAPLTLNVNSGVVGQPFSATISGLSVGSTITAISRDGSQGFYVLNGRVFNDALPYALNTLVLRETLAGTGARDSVIQIPADGIALGAAGLPAANAALGIGTPQIYNPSGLRRFRAALDGATASVAHIMAIGDSRTEGVGVDDPVTFPSNVNGDLYAWAGVLRTMFARMFGVAEAGMLYPSFQGADARVTPTGGALDSSTDPFLRSYRITSTGPGVITYNLPSCTAFDLLVYNDTNLPGTFSYTVDGGSAVNVTATQADADGKTSGFKRFAVTGLSQATHTVVVTGTSAGISVQCGIRYHSGSGVCVSRHAKAGYTILDAFGFGAASPGNNNAVGNASAAARMAAIYGAWSPALTVIHFDYNDWLAQISANFTSGLKPTPDVFQQYLQTAVTSIVAAGGCVLLLGGANSPSVTTPVGGQDLSAYWSAMKAIAASNDHCSAIILSEYWGSAADGIALGMNSSSTSIHPSRRGYGSMGRMLQTVLTGTSARGV